MTDYTNDIKRYLSGEMTPDERHAFEKKALSDPFLADALEGAEQLSAHEFDADVNELRENIKLASSGKSVKAISAWTWTLRIAAGILLISVSAFLIWTIGTKGEPDAPLAMESVAPLVISPEDTVASAATEQSMQDENPSAPASKQEPSVPQDRDRSSLADQAATETRRKEGTEAVPQEMELAMQKADGAPQKVELKPEEITEKEAVPLAKRAALEDAVEKEKAVSRAAGATARVQRVIRGKVTAQDDGTPLPGVNVVIKGSSLGTVTDGSGNYQVQTTTESPTLVFSFIGFQNTEVPAEGREQVDVQLGTDVVSLSEVAVVGSGVTTEGRLPPVIELAHPETGNRAFKQYLERSVQYPEQARTEKVQGRVTVEFVIDENGSLGDFSVVRGIGAGCDEELIRLIKEGPKWIPTRKDGVPVQDKARVRLKFDLPK